MKIIEEYLKEFKFSFVIVTILETWADLAIITEFEISGYDNNNL